MTYSECFICEINDCFSLDLHNIEHRSNQNDCQVIIEEADEADQAITIISDSIGMNIEPCIEHIS
jgi:hypothetical protein